MNENQNQDSSFGSGEVHDLDPVHNLVDGLLGGSGPLSVETVDDLLWPLGSDSGLQTFPYEGFDDSFTYLRSLLDGDSSILPPLGQQPLAPQLPVIGWELLPTGPTQMLGFALPQGYTQIGAFSSGIEDNFKLRPLFISSGMRNSPDLNQSGLVTIIGAMNVANSGNIFPWYCTIDLVQIICAFHKAYKQTQTFGVGSFSQSLEYYVFPPDSITGIFQQHYSVENLFGFAALLLSSTVLGKRGRTDSVTMPGPSRSAPDTTTKSSGSSSKKIKPETETEMPDYTKQYDFIKYWMFTSRLGPIAAPSTFDACFAAVTAEFGLDALTLEQVKANMNNQRSMVWKITTKLLSTETELKDHTIDPESTEGRGLLSEFQFTADLASNVPLRNRIHELATQAISNYAFAHADVPGAGEHEFCSELVQMWIYNVFFKKLGTFRTLARSKLPKESEGAIPDEIIACAIEFINSRYKDLRYHISYSTGGPGTDLKPVRYCDWNTTIGRVSAVSATPGFKASYLRWRQSLEY